MSVFSPHLLFFLNRHNPHEFSLKIPRGAQRKLKNIVMKAESMGTSLAEVFGVFDKDGSGFITASELEEGLRELRVFDTIPKDQVHTSAAFRNLYCSGRKISVDRHLQRSGSFPTPPRCEPSHLRQGVNS